MGRKKLNKDIEKNALINSRRRCALCYGLNRDISTKQGQIIHIDRKSSNDSEDNLLFLCLPCHDSYDTKRSQSKGITEKELKHYRDELYEAIEKKEIYNAEELEGVSPDIEMTANVIELLGSSNAINWLQNLVLTAPFKDDYLHYLRGFIHDYEQNPMFCFRDATLEKCRVKIYQGISEFMSIQAYKVQYDSKMDSYQLPSQIEKKYEICQVLDEYRAVAVSNYFEFVKRVKKLEYL